jgi:hypothetical protein
MVAEHLQVGVLDELAGRSTRKQRLTVRLPGVSDRVSAGSGLEVTTFSVSKKIGAHEISGAKLSRAVVAGSVAESGRSRCLPTPYPCTAPRIAGPVGRAHVPPHVLSAVDARDDVVPRQRIPWLRRFPADPTARLLEANLFARALVCPPPSW